MNDAWTEYIGYAAMGFIGISFLMKNIRTLRLLNLIGALIFVYYGLLLDRPPIYLLNYFIVLVNLYYLFIFNPKIKK